MNEDSKYPTMTVTEENFEMAVAKAISFSRSGKGVGVALASLTPARRKEFHARVEAGTRLILPKRTLFVPRR